MRAIKCELCRDQASFVVADFPGCGDTNWTALCPDCTVKRHESANLAISIPIQVHISFAADAISRGYLDVSDD